MKTRNHETASQARDRNFTEIDKRIRLLRTKVEETRDAFKRTGRRNWGYVGDLARINQILGEALGLEE